MRYFKKLKLWYKKLVKSYKKDKARLRKYDTVDKIYARMQDIDHMINLNNRALLRNDNDLVLEIQLVGCNKKLKEEYEILEKLRKTFFKDVPDRDELFI
jgi:hypothetical protein